MPEQAIEPLIIRFDGLDAERHEVDLGQLAESLQGLSKIIGVCANFALTERLVQHRDALSVRVVARPPERHCFEFQAWVQWISTNPLVSTIIGGLTVSLITYIFSWAANRREEMRSLKEALKQAITELGHRDEAHTARLLDTIDRMADSLRPSVKQAVAPVGRTAATLTVSNQRRTQAAIVDAVMKEAISAEQGDELGEEQDFHIRITELNMESGAFKFQLEGELEDETEDEAEEEADSAPNPDRYRGQIVDPAVVLPNNKYALSMAAKRQVTVRAKAMTRDGKIRRLFVSDILPDPSQQTTPLAPR